MERKTSFHPVGGPAQIRVVGRRRVRTLEGRLHGSALANPIVVAALALALIATGELCTLLVSGAAGITVHAIALVAFISHAVVVRRVAPTLSHLLVALAPAPLIRIVSLTSPLAQFSYVQWFTILAVIIYASIVTAVKILKPKLPDIGLRLPEARHYPLEGAVILAGLLFGWLEWHILTPGALVADLSIRSLIAPVIVLYVSTGLLEELLFRGLMQRYAMGALGKWLGVAFVTLVFAALHTGWNSFLDVLFVGSVGLIYSLVVLRTKSILGVSISHGITNAMLFLVMPILMR